MNTLKQTTTAALGIIPWQRRALIETAAPAIFIMIAVPSEDKNHPLLQTMQASFHLPADNLVITTLEQLNDDMNAHQPEHLLIFGDANVDTNVPTTHTHSLTQLAENPALKRDTYVVLKSLGLYA
jgi:DNA polymerase III psi subunit